MSKYEDQLIEEVELLEAENAELKCTLKLVWDFHKNHLDRNIQKAVLRTLTGNNKQG